MSQSAEDTVATSANTAATKELDDIALENMLVLVAEDSPHKLKLTQDCTNNLLGDDTGGSLHTLEFESHPGKVLRHYRGTHGQFPWHKWCRMGLKGKDEDKSQQDTLAKWSFRKPYLVTKIQGKEYLLHVRGWIIEEGTIINAVHWKDKNGRNSLRNLRGKDGDGEAFVVNEDGFIYPRDCLETKRLYVGIKGKMTDAQKQNFRAYVRKTSLNVFRNDAAKGHDTLGEDVIAKCLADHIADNRLEPPYALGIFGEWGAGKTTFFELMKKQLIEIQKEEVPKYEHQSIHAGHIYCVEFSAWTYYRGDNIWASLMYRIFNDLNDQLEIEELLGVSKKGGVSSIEVSEKLSRGERGYFQELLSKDKKKSKKEIEKIMRNVRNGLASDSFASVFEKQVKDDKEDLQAAKRDKMQLEEELDENKRKEAWRMKINDLKKSAIDSIQQRVVVRVLAEHGDDALKAAAELAKNRDTLQSLFHRKFSYCEQIWVHTKSSRIFGIFLIASVSGMLVVFVWVWDEYGDNIIAKLASLFTPLISIVVGVSEVIKKGTEVLKEQSDEFANEIKMIQDGVAILHTDIESGQVDENTNLLSSRARIDGIQDKIKKEEEKIRQVEGRLKVLAGQSVQDVVKSRVNSDKYESMLGIVHSAKQDLDALSDAMFNKYHDDIEANDGESSEGGKQKTFPRGQPRIVLFIDDLDRCDPEKLVEVLEAIQLLVKSKLFVIVAAIDLDYLCSCLETKKYEGILHSNKCPTGLDYLEKIFQLGYRVPAVISKSNMENYIDWQLVTSGEGEYAESNDADKMASNDDIEQDEASSTLGDSRSPMQTHLYFTSKEAQLLKESCVLFKLTPRTTKRIINVFTLIKQVVVLRKDSLDLTLQRHNLLLLVMAASSETKIGIQKVFNMMESSTMPTFKLQAVGVATGAVGKPTSSTAPKRNLRELVREHCSSIDNAYDDFECVKELEKYKFSNSKEWKKVSNQFDHARSFSFFRRMELKDDHGHKMDYKMVDIEMK